MEKSVHDWVENYKEYAFEAVFYCKNELPVWNQNQCLRAFQTFGWNDASTNEELTFSHYDTGAIINYDGKYVAVHAFTGPGSIVDAFFDLFKILESIGWREVEVFHAPETMHSLLIEIGKAIPANSSLDVKPAQRNQNINEFAEVVALVSQGEEKLLQDGIESINNAALAELSSMFLEESAMNNQPSSVIDSPQHGLASMALENDPAVPILTGSSAVGVNQDNVVTPFDSVELIDSQKDDPLSLALEIESLREEIMLANERVLAANKEVSLMADLIDQVNLEHDKTRAVRDELIDENSILKDAASVAAQDLVCDDDLSNLISAPATLLPVSVNVGLCSFIFDFAGSDVSVDFINSFVNDGGFSCVHHLYPGAIGGSLYWDVLGEVVSDYPWFAERLAEALGFDRSCRFLVAKTILALRSESAIAQLRDLPTSLKLPNDAHLRYFDGFGLCQDGLAFVDVRDDLSVFNPAASSAANEHARFTVRALVQSPVAHLFVVHVDSLDGNFVRWIAELLRSVAMAYSSSCRASHMGVATNTKNSEKAQEIEAAVAEMNVMVSKLRLLGVVT